MKPKRLICALILVAVMMFAVYASDVVFTYDILPDGTAAVTGASGIGSSCEIPKEIDGYTVTALGNGSPLVGFDEVDSVSLNSNVTKISDKAFYGNKQLNNIFNMGSVKSVGNYAFFGCEKLDSFLFENLEYIGEGAFAYCKSLSGIDSRIKLDSLKHFDGAGDAYRLPDGSYGYNTLAEAEKAPFYGCDGIVAADISCASFYLPMEIMFLDCKRITNIGVNDFNGSLNVWEFMVTTTSADGKLIMNFHPNAIMFTAYGDAAKSYAESKYMVYRPMYSEVKVIVDGNEIVSDQSALLMNSRTMVPLRAIFEKLGAEVFWNDETKTVKAVKDGKEIELTIEMNHMRVGTEIVYLDVAPLLFNSRTLVPLRAVSEAFDCKVNWDGDTRTVTVDKNPDSLMSSEKFVGINYEKAMATGKDAKFIPSVETMFNGENSIASEKALKAFPIRQIGEDRTLFSAATILCDTIYNFDYRDTEALANIVERIETATVLANGDIRPIRGGVMYSYWSVFNANKNVEQKIVSEAFFASSPQNCIQVDGPMPQCLLQTIKGYLYIKYDSFDDPDFTLELGKWYRTEVEITFGYTQTPNTGVNHSISVASLGFEEVPEDLLA